MFPARLRTAVRTVTEALSGRLSRRLLAWFLVFSLVPLLVTNTVGYRRSERIIRGLVQDYLATIARL